MTIILPMNVDMPLNKETKRGDIFLESLLDVNESFDSDENIGCNDSKQEKRVTVNFVVLADDAVKLKESEKFEKYLGYQIILRTCAYFGDHLLKEFPCELIGIFGRK